MVAVEVITDARRSDEAALDMIEIQRALEKTESGYRDLLVGANVAMCVCALDGTIVEVNDVAAALTGYTVDELTGLDISRLLTPASLRTARKRQRLRLSRRRANRQCRLELLKKDGTRAIVESVARLVVGNGKPLAVQALVRDITQEALTQEALRESEQQYRRIVETSQEGIWVIDAQSKTVFANTTLARMLGYSADEMHRRSLLEFMAPEQRPRAEHLVERRRHGVTEHHDLEFLRKDGSRLWAMVSTAPILDEHGDYAGALGMIADITERKQAEQALQRERTEMQMILDSVPAIVFHKDREGRFVRVNGALVEASGIPEDQWLGRTVFHLFPHLAAGYHRDDEEVMTSGRPKRNIIERLESPAGTRWVRTDKIPLRDSDGNVVGLIGLSTDITEQKRAEEALSASERRYHGLFDIASDAIIIGDLRGDIIQANKAAVTLAGYGLHELAGMNISRLLTPESAIVAVRMWQELVEGEGDRRGEWELVNRDGARAAADVALTLMMEEGKAAAVQAVLRDVTQLKRWRDNMLYYISAKIRAREDERKRIARELHDETVQDLASLLLEIEAISRSSGGLPNGVRTHLEKARDRVETIMEGVRRISHELRPQMLDHLGLLAALEWLTEEMAVSYGIEAEVKIAGTPRRLSPDTELTLFRIAQEALNNVRKTSRATEATVCIEFKADEVRLAVADNGTGFALPDMLSDFAAKGQLGLLGMHERARSLGGMLSVHSEPGKGTVVTVDIPAQPSSTPRAAGCGPA